jgi:hypothetical protein
MPRRAPIASVVTSLLLPSLVLIGAIACQKKPKYDDVPIARDDRKKKSPEPPETFDVEAICAQLVDLPGAGIESSQKSDLRKACLDGLAAVQKSSPNEYACRCRCIRGAGDLFAVERCTRFCDADDVQRVCDHVVGVESDTNDASVFDDAHDECVKGLKKLRADDPARWTCTLRCLVTATAKDDALACNGKCGGEPTPDAGTHD